MQKWCFLVAVAVLGAATACAQQQTSVVLNEETIVVKYSPTAANNRISASLHTEADLVFQGVNVPKGDYTMFVLADGSRWQLAVNKATGAKAATYDPKLDVGRAPLTLSKPPAASAAGACKITLTRTAAVAAKLEVAWNNTVASAAFYLDRSASDTEW